MKYQCKYRNKSLFVEQNQKFPENFSELMLYSIVHDLAKHPKAIEGLILEIQKKRLPEAARNFANVNDNASPLPNRIKANCMLR